MKWRKTASLVYLKRRGECRKIKEEEKEKAGNEGVTKRKEKKRRRKKGEKKKRKKEGKAQEKRGLEKGQLALQAQPEGGLQRDGRKNREEKYKEKLLLPWSGKSIFSMSYVFVYGHEHNDAGGYDGENYIEIDRLAIRH